MLALFHPPLTNDPAPVAQAIAAKVVESFCATPKPVAKPGDIVIRYVHTEAGCQPIFEVSK